ncbi:MAG: hypothetical protein BWK78_07915, partial [Thiotrichaceae bacterium IS1]
MDNSIITIFYFVLGLLLAFICGYGIVTFLLPKELREYRFILMIPLGYGLVCWLADLIAIALDLTLLAAIKIVFPLLIFTAIVAHFLANPHDTFRDVFRGLREVFLLSLPICIFILWPLFYVGAETFQASVNPDWFASLQTNHYLKNNSLNWFGNLDTDHYRPFFSGAMSWGTPSNAHFTGSYYAILLEWLLSISGVMALSIVTGMFFFCMPLATYFMVRVALNQPRAIGILGAILVGISSPIALSFFYYLVGQNSGWSFMLLSLALLFLSLTGVPSHKLSLLTAIVLSILFSMYLVMLPFAVTPVGIVIAYFLTTKKVKLLITMRTSLHIAIYFLLLNALLFQVHIKQIIFSLGYSSSMPMSFSFKYFSDFITEKFIPLFLGIAPYPLSSNLEIVLVLSFVIIGWLVYVLYTLKTNHQASFPLYGAMLITLVLVWWHFTFNEPFAYGLFKISIWLQYIPVILYATGFYYLWQKMRDSLPIKRVFYFAVTSFLGGIVVGGNLITTVQSGIASLGNDLFRQGVIVHNISGNKDYPELTQHVSQFVKPEESIGLLFTNISQNNWVTYYLRDFKLSLLNQYVLPGEYEQLPGLLTRKYLATAGNLETDNNPYFHGATDDFYLTWNGSDVIEKTTAKPLWENKTFRLYKASETPDFAFIGRGFYRYETSPKTDYWQP